MSDMWNNVTIKNPGTITLESLALNPAFNGDGDMWEDVDSDFLDDDLYVQGGSKYTADDLIEAIVALSAEHPEATITHSETWTGEGPTEEEWVYRAGAVVREESRVSNMVPVLLPELVAAVREALDAKTLAIHETNKPTRHPIEEAARALVDALDPRGAAE
jgi:hypothetical protein